jgi:hypothetical protein
MFHVEQWEVLGVEYGHDDGSERGSWFRCITEASLANSTWGGVLYYRWFEGAFGGHTFAAHSGTKDGLRGESPGGARGKGRLGFGQFLVVERDPCVDESNRSRVFTRTASMSERWEIYPWGRKRQGSVFSEGAYAVDFGRTCSMWNITRGREKPAR